MNTHYILFGIYTFMYACILIPIHTPFLSHTVFLSFANGFFLSQAAVTLSLMGPDLLYRAICVRITNRMLLLIAFMYQYVYIGIAIVCCGRFPSSRKPQMLQFKKRNLNWTDICRLSQPYLAIDLKFN